MVTIQALFDCRVPYLVPLFASCTYAWDLLPRIGDWIDRLLQQGIEGFVLWKPGILVGHHVRIAPTATLEAPAVIGHGTHVRPGAYIRGRVITGEGCVMGNSCEYKNCILLDGVQTPHYTYVGDSVLGNRAHTGAGTICSNLKADGSDVVIRGTSFAYATGLRKVGAFLADGANVGCSCVLNPGTVIGRDTSVYPGNTLRGVFPPHAIVKDQKTVVPRL